MSRFYTVLALASILVSCSKNQPDNGPADPQGPQSTSSRTLVMRGGGWESAEDLLVFEEYVPDGTIAIVLSATRPDSQQGTQYFLNWYRSRMQHSLEPIYTNDGAASESTQSAQHPSHVSKIQSAAGVIITGGEPSRLRHLVGTPLGNAIKRAYDNGVPVYANSAGLSILGPYFTWNATQESNHTPGLGLIPAPVLSHIDDYDLYCELWALVPAASSIGIGISKATVAILRGGELQTHSRSAGKIFVYREKPQAGCVPPSLSTGQVYSLF